MYSPRRSSAGAHRSPAAVDRVHSVWPGLSTTWLYNRVEEVARAGVPRWIQNEFWIAEVDPILRVGIARAHRFRCGAVDAVLKAHPVLHAGAVWVRPERFPESAKLREFPASVHEIDRR